MIALENKLFRLSKFMNVSENFVLVIYMYGVLWAVYFIRGLLKSSEQLYEVDDVFSTVLVKMTQLERDRDRV